MATKATNEYAQQFGRAYAKIPKAVFAAVAFSYASSGGEVQEHGFNVFLEEWQTLYENGIVPQKPPKDARR